MPGIEDIAAMTPWAYLVFGCVTFLDVFLPFVPSETTVIAGGVLASATGELSAAVIVVVAALGSWLGDVLAYRIGRSVGVRRSRTKGRGRTGIRAGTGGIRARARGKGGEVARLRWLRDALAAGEGRVVVFARFVPAGRTVVSFAAGGACFPPRRFVRLTLLASVLWAGLAVCLGYAGGETFRTRPWLAVLVSKAVAASLLALAELCRRRLAANRDARVPVQAQPPTAEERAAVPGYAMSAAAAGGEPR
ncbi:DedA family protein [Streptomyces sp. NPDC012935]|uniref:DedA family protein n=1 Tax=Streptomyces sp. NPDC012935 TaxID=3364857 RepID=UPI0036B63104